jgi:hypothetical protein
MVHSETRVREGFGHDHIVDSISRGPPGYFWNAWTACSRELRPRAPPREALPNLSFRGPARARERAIDVHA